MYCEVYSIIMIEHISVHVLVDVHFLVQEKGREEKRREGMQLDFQTVDTKTALCRSGITVFNYWPFKL